MNFVLQPIVWQMEPTSKHTSKRRLKALYLQANSRFSLWANTFQSQSLFGMCSYLSINLSWMDWSTCHESDICKRKIFTLNGDKHKTNFEKTISSTSSSSLWTHQTWKPLGWMIDRLQQEINQMDFLQKNKIFLQYQNSEETNKHGKRKKESSRRWCWMLATCKRRKKNKIYGEIFSARFFIDRCKRENSMRR